MFFPTKGKGNIQGTVLKRYSLTLCSQRGLTCSGLLPPWTSPKCSLTIISFSNSGGDDTHSCMKVKEQLVDAGSLLPRGLRGVIGLSGGGALTRQAISPV